MGIPYFFEMIGLLLIYLYNLPKYCYQVMLALYFQKQLPNYKNIFYIHKYIEKPISIRLIGFTPLMLFIVLFIVLSRF